MFRIYGMLTVISMFSSYQHSLMLISKNSADLKCKVSTLYSLTYIIMKLPTISDIPLGLVIISHEII